MFHIAGIPSPWSLFWVVFIVIPVVRWSVGWGGRRRSWRMERWDWAGDGQSSREVADLRAELESRLADIDLLNQRVAELENRVDFTERLMAQPRDPALLSHPSNSD